MSSIPPESAANEGIQAHPRLSCEIIGEIIDEIIDAHKDEIIDAHKDSFRILGLQKALVECSRHIDNIFTGMGQLGENVMKLGVANLARFDRMDQVDQQLEDLREKYKELMEKSVKSTAETEGGPPPDAREETGGVRGQGAISPFLEFTLVATCWFFVIITSVYLAYQGLCMYSAK